MKSLVDVEIPSRAWEAWREAGKPRLLRRPLTGEERIALIERRDELEPWIVGYHAKERDEVVSVLADMLGSFSSANARSDAQVITHLDALSRKLSRYPKWAISRVCERVGLRGWTKEVDGRNVVERHWAPSDPDVVEMVEREVKLYGRSYQSAVDLLAAEVADS